MALHQDILQLRRSSTPAGTFNTLMELGTRFYNFGRNDDALGMFEAAHLALRNPSELSVFSKQIERGQILLRTSATRSDCTPLPCQPADTYQEDDDVGPRHFREPLLPESNADTLGNLSLRAFILYNKALIAHARFDFHTATTLYNEILQGFALSMRGNVSAFSPKVVQLLMFVNNNMGQIAYSESSEETALAYFEASLLFAKHLSAASNQVQLATATVLSNFCRVHWMSGDVSESIYSALCEVLRIRSSVLEETHTDVASAHYNLGVAEYARRNNESAIRHLMRYLQVAALRAQEDLQSDLDPVPALVHILLMKNEDKEDDPMAQELVRGLRTLQDKRNDLGPQHPEIASIFNFVGTLLFHQRDFDHSLLFFQEELRLEEAFLGPNKEDVSVSVTCNNIGRILQELQRLPEAIRYYNRALEAEYGHEIRLLQSKSKQPLSTAQALARNEDLNLPASTMNLYSTVWYNLGLIHDKQGSYSEAIHAFQMSLGLRRVMLGRDHPDVACLLYNIGVLQMEQQLLKDSSDSFREALRIRRVAATGQLNDGHVCKTLQKLSSLHKANGNIDGALEATREILHIQQLSPDFDTSLRNKEVGSTLKELAELYHAEGNVLMAVVKAKESVAILRQVKNEAHNTGNYVACVEELFSSLLLLGSLYHESCEPARAFAVFSEASAMVQTVKSDSNEHSPLDALREVSQMLATCHCAPEA